MILTVLSWYNQIEELVSAFIFRAKKVCRRMLGPEVSNLYLLKNGDIVPSYFSNLDEHLSTAHVYDVETQRISHALTPLEGRYRPIPDLGLCVLLTDGKKIDLTDWLGAIRMNPLIPLSPKHLVDLWSLSTNTYIKYSIVEVTDNMGDVHTVTYNS